MSSQKIINIYLKPRKALVLATVSCGIILGLFLWKFCNPDNINNGELPILAAIFSIGVYLTIKLSSYQLLLCNDRIIRKLWWRKKEILYRNIDRIIINASCFDAYKIGKAINPQIFKKLEKYQIFDVWIIGNECNIHFKRNGLILSSKLMMLFRSSSKNVRLISYNVISVLIFLLHVTLS